jgi:DNA-binding NarL/FixJ family response regulator
MNGINIRILLCDDHSLFRNGLISLLKDEPGFFIIGEAEDGEDMINKYNLLKPDIILADISMPKLTGTEAVKKLKVLNPDVKVLFLSMLHDEQYIYYTWQVGGKGLVDKNIARGELVYAINEIYRGNNYFGPLCDENQLKELIAKYEFLNIKQRVKHEDGLTETEEKVLYYIKQGITSAEIAAQMEISKRTVDSHRTKIMQKYQLKSLPALIKLAMSYNFDKNV